jgi:hypothetical protein
MRHPQTILLLSTRIAAFPRIPRGNYPADWLGEEAYLSKTGCITSAAGNRSSGRGSWIVNGIRLPESQKEYPHPASVHGHLLHL